MPPKHERCGKFPQIINSGGFQRDREKQALKEHRLKEPREE
jgi:hypothetical protein